MKVIKAAPQQKATYKVGDEIIFQYSIFDGRTSELKRKAMTVTKVNMVTIIAEDKNGNWYGIDPREDNITTREQLIKNLNDSIE